MNILKRQSNESVNDFLLRVAELKRDNKDITWQGIADALGLEFGIEKSERWVRRRVAEIKDHMVELDTLDLKTKALHEQTLNLQKERVKFAEERTQNRAYIRKLSREETLKEIALAAASEIGSKKFLSTPANIFNAQKHTGLEAILCISDWHYGIEIKNPWNEFSPDICKSRVAHLRDKTIEYIKLHKVNKLYVANLGDLIAGRIHLGLRLDSKFDVVTQTIQVSEILAEFLSDLSNYVEIDYYDTLDNHSRLEPNKSEAQDLETLVRIIPWYLKERLKNNNKIKICENEFGWDLMTFTVAGHNVIGVHGDKDKPQTAVSQLNNFTQCSYAMVLMAHRHHTSLDEQNNTLCVCNGSLMGTDAFAQKLRLSAKPTQNLIIVSKENVMEAFYRIVL